MKKNIFRILPLSILLVSFFLSCGMYPTEKEIQDDRGMPIQKMEMSPSSILISGYKGIDKKSVSVNYYPSIADDVEIFWSSSDENVVTVSKTGATTCDVILQGNGNATVTAKNYSGKVTAECSVKAVLESTPPFEVQNLSLTPFSNNIKVQFKTPELNAQNLSSALIEVYDDADDLVYSKTLNNITEKNTVYETRAGYVNENNCLYNFATYSVKVYMLDVNGNKSECVIGSVTTTAEETNAPAAVSNVTLADFTDAGALINWTDPLDADLQLVEIEVYLKGENKTCRENIAVKAGVQSALVTGISSDKNYDFYLTAVDNNFNRSDEVNLEYINGPHVENIQCTLSEKYSGIINLTWTDPDTVFENIKVTAVSNEGDLLTKIISAGTEKCTLKNLIPGSDYSISFTTLDDENKILGSTSISQQPSKILIRFWSRNSSNFMVATSSGSFKTQNDDSAAYQKKWLKMPPLNGMESIDYDGESETGTAEAYSLMAMKLNGTGSGLYAVLKNPSSTQTNSAAADITLMTKQTVEAGSYESTSTFFTAAAGAGKSLRLAENYFMLGANTSNEIVYRYSKGVPGYTDWQWNITEEIVNQQN